MARCAAAPNSVYLPYLGTTCKPESVACSHAHLLINVPNDWTVNVAILLPLAGGRVCMLVVYIIVPHRYDAPWRTYCMAPAHVISSSSW